MNILIFLPASEFISGLGVLAGIPYGICLLVLNIKRITRRDYSLSIVVYHLGSWLAWITLSTLKAIPFADFFR